MHEKESGGTKKSNFFVFLKKSAMDGDRAKRSDTLLERSRERLQRGENKRRFERQNNRRSRSANDDNSEKGSRFVHTCPTINPQKNCVYFIKYKIMFCIIDTVKCQIQTSENWKKPKTRCKPV